MHSSHFAERRYLINFDGRRLGQVVTDVLVIGTGVAGLRAALAAAETGANVVVTTKDGPFDCNTAYAQGGVAVVAPISDVGSRMSDGRSNDSASDPDTIEAHVEDTLTVACGLGHRAAVEVMCREGAACLRELIAWGGAFDLKDGVVALGLEGGHSRPRIVHARGDATGRELSEVLVRRARATESIRVFDRCFVIDLVTVDSRCLGAITHHPQYGHQVIWAGQTVLASGGAGCLYRETTNPPGATGDGHAIAFRAGAVLRDMEFMQFHPTTLYVAGASRALISEAVRGEGAHLVDRHGYRFMPDYHADAELAPRDVVSRAIVRQMKATASTCAYLDVRHFPAGRFEQRFPNIARLCRDFDIDVARQPIPVRPSAHYMIGGVAVDAEGRTGVDGLWACGEASSTGVHGANRLASNSLLEGLVFGKVVGRLAAAAAADWAVHPDARLLKHMVPPSPRTELDLSDVRNSLRAVCWRNVGIERTADRLRETLEIINFWGRYVMDKALETREGWETQNLLTVGHLAAQAALAREESRGVHYRQDFPEIDDRRFRGHVTLRSADGIISDQFVPVG